MRSINMIGHSLNKPTFDTTGRRIGTKTGRALTDRSVSRSNIIIFLPLAKSWSESISARRRVGVNSLPSIHSEQLDAALFSTNPAAHPPRLLPVISSQGLHPG